MEATLCWLLARLRQAEIKLAALQNRAAVTHAPIPDILPGVLDRYRRLVDRLPDLLLSQPDRARSPLSGIIERITLRPETGTQC